MIGSSSFNGDDDSMAAAFAFRDVVVVYGGRY